MGVTYDGASNSKKNRAGLILISPKDVITEHALRFNFNTLNNIVEYELLIVELKMTKELDVKRLKVFIDSQRIIG